MSDAKSKNILKIEENEEKIECIKETFKILFDIIINFTLFAFLFSNALSTLMSDFVVNEIVATC